MRLKIIFGIILLFTGEFAFASKQCLAGSHWVEAHHRRAYVRYDGVSVRATTVTGHCRENPRGYKKWHRKLSNGRPGIWGYKREKSKKWAVEESERFLSAISVLPDKLVHLKGVSVYRMKASKDPTNPATSNGRDIVLYDLAFQHKDSLSQILSHELSHVIYGDLNKEERDRFKYAAGWIKYKERPGAYTTVRGKTFIQPDSRISIVEDFANHMEHFLFRGGSLKEKSPKAHKFIKSKFGHKFKIKRVK